MMLEGEKIDEDTVLTPTSSMTSLSPDSNYYQASVMNTNGTVITTATTPLHSAHTAEQVHPPYHHASPDPTNPATASMSFPPSPLQPQQKKRAAQFTPIYPSSRLFQYLSHRLGRHPPHELYTSTWIGFWALLHVTCANYVLTPMRDAVALAVGVQHMPTLTLASTALAVISSVPIGWLFEAPDPQRRKVWKRMGLTRGETQGTSLALFYRCFALSVLSYAIGFKGVSMVQSSGIHARHEWPILFRSLGQFLYVAFFLVVHLMKLHSLSLVWGVTTEAMEYEEVARKQHGGSKTRLQRLASIGFGGTLGGILGSVIASSLAHILHMSGLLIVAALLLEISAELSIELGRIMQMHWEEQQLFRSTDNLASLDTSMQRSTSLGSMKRVASGNSLHSKANKSHTNLSKLAEEPQTEQQAVLNEDSFTQRLKRGVTTILRSRLLMAIFTYNALYASTSVLLSFQRAALVASRNATSSTESDTAFLANINMTSSLAVFVLQLSGVGAFVAHRCGSRLTLALMPIIRLLGVLCLAWWHVTSKGQPPNLFLFLMLDECTRVMNLAVAKPVRESLWRGLSNEARYEAKPIVDTIANRWGGGSAAFLVSLMDTVLDFVGGRPEKQEDGSRDLFGFPPVLFLCICVAAWWTVVSADLGNIRRRIDIELKKKHQ